MRSCPRWQNDALCSLGINASDGGGGYLHTSPPKIANQGGSSPRVRGMKSLVLGVSTVQSRISLWVQTTRRRICNVILPTIIIHKRRRSRKQAIYPPCIPSRRLQPPETPSLCNSGTCVEELSDLDVAQDSQSHLYIYYPLLPLVNVFAI